jgi:hypothetical protein
MSRASHGASQQAHGGEHGQQPPRAGCRRCGRPSRFSAAWGPRCSLAARPTPARRPSSIEPFGGDAGAGNWGCGRPMMKASIAAVGPEQPIACTMVAGEPGHPRQEGHGAEHGGGAEQPAAPPGRPGHRIGGGRLRRPAADAGASSGCGGGSGTSGGCPDRRHGRTATRLRLTLTQALESRILFRPPVDWPALLPSIVPISQDSRRGQHQVRQEARQADRRAQRPQRPRSARMLRTAVKKVIKALDAHDADRRFRRRSWPRSRCWTASRRAA